VNPIGWMIIADGIPIQDILLVKKRLFLFANLNFFFFLYLDDEDTIDDQEAIKLSSTKKSHLTINEHERFSKEKETFRRKYDQQIEQVKIPKKKRFCFFSMIQF
jgi:hypothetical protein